MPIIPSALLAFADHVRRGEFWHAHEALEAAWREGRSPFYHGLILLASAWVHVQRRNPRGVRAQARKAQRALAPYPAHYLGLDVRALRRGLSTMHRVAQASDDADGIAWHELPALPPLEPAAARLRGDEPELGGRGRGPRRDGIDPALRPHGTTPPGGTASTHSDPALSSETRNVVIIGAGARGNRVFADLIARHDTGFRNAGVVELDPARRRAFQERYQIPDERAFSFVEDFLAAPRFGDVVFICTPDPTHFSLCQAVSQKGYDVLLEKPIATSLPDCLALLDVEQTHGNRIFVAHVLRYSPFFRTIKEIVDGGELGPIRNLRLSENVGHWHFAHSYVRGNWRRRDLSAPVILTKSSHDLDIVQWLVGRRVRSVTSFGGLRYFTSRNVPPGAAGRCVNCQYKDDCLYSATRFYLNERPEWPFDVIAPPPATLEQRRQAIEEGPYGRCVWLNDNDVCDTQTVLLEFANGTHATFELQALTADNTRQIRILFDTAELTGDLHKGTLQISHFTGRKDELRVEPVPLPDAADSHGGGDLQLLHSLHDHLTRGGNEGIMTSLRSSLPSHVLAFLADESRLRRRRMPVPEIFGPVHPRRARAPGLPVPEPPDRSVGSAAPPSSADSE